MSSAQATIKASSGLHSHLGACLGKNLPKLTQIWGRINFLVVVGLRAPVSCWLFQVVTLSFPMGFPTMATYFTKPADRISRKSVLARWGLIKCNLVMELTSHHVCYIPLVRSRSQVLPTLNGRELSKV